MSMKERFEDRETLIGVLLDQKIIRGNLAIAQAFAEAGQLEQFTAGQNIINQGETDRSVYFIISGRAQIIINGVRLYFREAGNTVGEMSAINPKIGRSATLEAVEQVLTLKVGHHEFEHIGKSQPEMWQLVAQDLALRLEQRNQFVNRANLRSRIFMICSAEALPIAKSIRVGLSHDADVEIWSDDMIFPAGGYPIEALEEQVNVADFGIALCEPDDLITARGKTSAVPRDNVIFELGFFMSRLGRHRTLLLVPHRTDVTLPSDFKGLTPLFYSTADKSRDRAVALGPVIDRISAIIEERGVRASLVENK